ncbi:MAG: hypothetical protein RIB98_14730 [Acidimicrobiales bacterium]
MNERQPVKVDERFLELLDTQLGGERDPKERFATAFHELMTPIADRPDYRSVLSVGTLVPRVLVTGVVEADGAVNPISVRIDMEAGWWRSPNLLVG